MARDLKIVRRIDVIAVSGLAQPQETPQIFPLWWHEIATGSLPRIVRFIWLPTDGEMRIGLHWRHKLMLPKDAPYPLEAYLRGFSFPCDQALALRSYYWPKDAYDDFDRSHAILDRRVAGAFLWGLRPSIPRGTKIFTAVDNRFLRDRFGHLSMDW